MNSKNRTEPTIIPLALGIVLALACISLMANGYVFGTGNQNAQLPIIMRFLDPSLCQSDWFLHWYFDYPNFAWFYGLVFAGLSKAFGALDVAYLIVYVAGLVTRGVVVYCLATSIWKNRGVGLIAVLMMLYSSSLGELGVSPLVTRELEPAFLAHSLVLLSAYWLYRQYYVRSAALLFLTGLFHPLIGPESTALLALATFLSLGSSARREVLTRLLLVFLAGALPIAIGFLSTGGQLVENQAEVIRIMAWERAPWHYVPFTWGRDVWLNFALFVIPVIVARLRVPASKFLDWIALGVVGCFVFGTLSFAWEPLLVLVKLQPFRMSVLLQWVGALYLARYCWKWVSDERRVIRVAGVVLLMVLCLLRQLPDEFSIYLAAAVMLSEVVWYLRGRLASSGTLDWLPAVPIFALVVPIGVTLVGASLYQHWGFFFGVTSLMVALLGAAAMQFSRYSGVAIVSAGVATIIALTVVCFAWFELRALAWLSPAVRRLETHLSYAGALGDIELYIRENTPRDAVFVTPPYDATFRLKAQRAIVVDVKSFVSADQAVLEWYQRISDLAGVREISLADSSSAMFAELKEAYRALDRGQLMGIAEKYGAQYILTERGKSLDLPMVYENESYVLYRLAPFSLLECQREMEMAQYMPPRACIPILIEGGYLTCPDLNLVPFEWRGADSVGAKELAQAAPPLAVSGSRGVFTFTRIPTNKDQVIRVSWVPTGAEATQPVIQFGPRLNVDLSDTGTRMPPAATEDGFQIRPGQTLVLLLRVRLSPSPQSDVSERAEAFVQDRTERWERSTTTVDGTEWKQYTVVRRIRPDATAAVVGLRWQPSVVGEWLEIGDMRVFVTPCDH
jgi:Domain of unknown function (DUF6798)